MKRGSIHGWRTSQLTGCLLLVGGLALHQPQPAWGSTMMQMMVVGSDSSGGGGS